MDSKARAAQCRLECEILSHVKDALRLTLKWDVAEVGLARKVSTVRFTMDSFFRHVDRIMSLEEEEGYMAIVREWKPNLADKAVSLKCEHAEFRSAMKQIASEFDALTQPAVDSITAMCEKIEHFLVRVEKHNQKEADLLAEACWSDEGGEG